MLRPRQRIVIIVVISNNIIFINVSIDIKNDSIIIRLLNLDLISLKAVCNIRVDDRK